LIFPNWVDEFFAGVEALAYLAVWFGAAGLAIQPT
jgi:hypothetical protein